MGPLPPCWIPNSIRKADSMNAGDKESLGDQRSDAAVQVPGTAAVADAARSVERDQWLVIVNEVGGLAAAVRAAALSKYPERRPLLSILADLPPMIRAHARAPVSRVLQPWMLEELESGSAIIVAHADHVRVLGGSALEQILKNLDTLRGATNLQGDPAIAELLKVCRYRRNRGQVCGYQHSFAAPPNEMPACPDPQGLGDHMFEW